MDDMTEFDRQLSSGFKGLMGPSEPVDDAAVFTRITATQSPKWRFQSMFSATKFVVAGVIVALFGGFLLAGALTQPSEEVAPAATSAGPGTFSPTGSLSGIGRADEATLLPDGRVLVVGRVRPEVPALAIWDPETDSFTSAGGLGERRTFHEVAVLPDGDVLLVGRPTAEVWNPGTETSEPTGRIPAGRIHGSSTILPDGRVLFVGGQPAGTWRMLPAAEVWDPKTATSASAGTLLEARYGHTATALADGRVLVVGGRDEEGFLVSSEVWDPATLTFSPAGTLAEARENRLNDGYHTATLLADGRVLIVGGLGEDSNTPLASAEVWDPATLTFSPAGTLAETRVEHTASLLPDGRVLVIGGSDSSTAVDRTEIWDRTTESFTPGASLQQGRAGHTATVLADGRVLVIGGDAENGTGLFSAEVWEPSGYARRSDDTDADTTTPDLLPGVDPVTEEVEPGVYRVLSDGVRDLSTDVRNVVVMADGSVLVEQFSVAGYGGPNTGPGDPRVRDARVVELGVPGISYQTDAGQLHLELDGGVPNIWVGGEWSYDFDGGQWMLDSTSDAAECDAVEPDGSCWWTTFNIFWNGLAQDMELDPVETPFIMRVTPDGEEQIFTRDDLGLAAGSDFGHRWLLVGDGTV